MASIAKTVYVRKFNSDKVEEATTDDYKPSTYFPEPIKDAFGVATGRRGNIRDNDYIIGPLYGAGDFQVGVTGGMEVKEDPEHAIARELGEEIGLIPKNYDKMNFIRKYITKKHTTYVYELYINDSVPVLESQHGANLSIGKDLRNKKVGCFIYGPKKKVIEYLDSENIYLYSSQDDIIGVAAIKVKDIFDLYEV